MLLIKNCKLTLGEYKEAVSKEIRDLLSLQDIFIFNERIFKIKNNIQLETLIPELESVSGTKISLSDIKIIDACGKYVIPGVIDAHTHMRDPGLSYKEDFITGSKACAKGGVTTFIEMPNTIPQTITEEFLLQKREHCKGRSYVDYGFNFGGSNSDNSLEIEKVKDSVASTKIFLNMSTGDMLIDNNNSAKNIFSSSKIISVHAEGDKVEEAILLAHKYNKPLYLCHISEKSEIDVIKKYKELGYNIFAEVTPHHLFLNDKIKESSDYNRETLLMKPELKSPEDNIALIDAITTGIIDTIGTDHAPHTLEDKKSKTTYGIPSIENSLEIMLNLVKNKKITLYKLTQIMCEKPSQIFNIKDKGSLKEGYFGDIVILDLDNMYTISNKDVVSKCNWTPFNGFLTGGKVETTILRGNIVYDNSVFSSNLLGKEIKYN